MPFVPDNKTSVATKGFVPDEKPKEKKRGIFSRAFGVVKKELGEAGSSIRKTYEDSKAKKITPMESDLQTAGAIAGAVGGVAGDALIGAAKLVLPKSVEEGVAASFGNAIAESDIPQVVAKYDEWAAKHPRAAKNLGAVVDIVSLLPTYKGGQVATRGAKTATKVGGEVVENLAKTVDNAMPKPDVDELVGKVTQGAIKDVKPARRALSTLDTTGVKTYEDLGTVGREKIKELVATQDNLLAQDSTVYKLPQLSRTVKVGEKSAEQNFVKSALDDLEELYKATNDTENLLRIQTIKEKGLDVANPGNGLTLKDVNNIAREYGSEFGQKAFSKKGDPLTSVNAVRYENTRKGLKTTVRKLFGTDELKALDGQISDLIKFEENVKEMAEKVNKLSQRIQKRNIIEKLGKALGQAADLATFGGPRAFITKFLIPSNVGLKTMNSLDLEQQLPKLLRKIEKYNTATDDELFEMLKKELLKK